MNNRKTRKNTSPGEVQEYFRSVVLRYEGTECLYWPYSHVQGYGKIAIAGKMRRVHRLACEEQCGPAPTSAHEASHSCGNGKFGCVTKKHLSWKTSKENNADKVTHGTVNRGENNGRVKLTHLQAGEILSLKNTFTQDEIAKLFRVSQSTVSFIHSRKTWKHLETLS